MRTPDEVPGRILFAIDEKFTRARRRHWLTHGYLAIPLPFVLPIIELLPIPALQRDGPPLTSLALIEGIFCGIVALSIYLFRPLALRINRVAITTEGLYPPMKPKGSKAKGDWFVNYRDIARMELTPQEPAEAAAFWPVYDVSLTDGQTFRINPYDLMYYAKESVGDKYCLLLEACQREVNGTPGGERISMLKDHLGPHTKLPILVTEPLPWSRDEKAYLAIFLLIGIAGIAAAIYSIFFKR